jgi:hypothetical protein
MVKAYFCPTCGEKGVEITDPVFYRMDSGRIMAKGKHAKCSGTVTNITLKESDVPKGTTILKHVKKEGSKKGKRKSKKGGSKRRSSAKKSKSKKSGSRKSRK